MTKRVEGKIAVVVGAGQTPGETIGNGAAIAQLLAREGAAVLCVDRSGERAEKTAKDISSTGAVVSSMEADITVADDCDRVYIDFSKNGSKRYCDTGNCGNRMNVIAYRERKAKESA